MILIKLTFYISQSDVESGTRNKMNGTFLVTKTRNIQQGQGLIERPWLDFGKPREETNLFMTKQNWLGWGKLLCSTKDVLLMAKNLNGSSMSTGSSQMRTHRPRYCQFDGPASLTKIDHDNFCLLCIHLFTLHRDGTCVSTLMGTKHLF